jgi:ubiquinone biosynthesis protein UbiJ
MQLPIILLSSIETAMNAWLKLDDEAMPQFESMQDKVIRLHITGLEINLYFFPGVNHIQVLSEYEGEPDTIIHGSPMALMRLTTSDDAGKTLLDTDAFIEGNTGLGTRFSQVLKSVDIDWEEFLSKVVGDVIAHQAGSVVEQTKGWVQDSEHAMRLNIGEYLSEESQLVVAESELSHYLDEVDNMRADIDRMQARVQRLKNTITEEDTSE